ncbi:ComF family protein [Bifidobacterium sp. 82T24]|uniref:ComF family protein n=1 Tax=Bifidobacterium pluvialisilvae TaxID=2834436 RepID=UPI001C58819F|nr:phosphoribosyltransferase family protein [Bifidobacterium pluvialisilvae]MBW3087893.1 ComF family protein [Bifidobacterium pluvialisilvae]
MRHGIIRRRVLRESFIALLREVRDVVIPRGCAGCDRPDETLCPECRALFSRLATRDMGGIGMGVFSAGRYGAETRRAILRWKDHGDEEVTADFRDVISRCVIDSGLPRLLCAAGLESAGLMVVPVPSTAASSRSRGRHHTLPLAEAVRDALRDGGVNAEMGRALSIVGRLGKSVQQSGVAGRIGRLEGHIRVDGRLLGNGGKAVLVDDIITTGSTLQQCVHALERQGVDVMAAYTLASVHRREIGPSDAFVGDDGSA